MFTVPLVEMKCTISYLFTDMTLHLECSQFPLLEMEPITSLTILFICSYDNTTGVFTVPPGGDGVYYFSTYLLVQTGEFGHLDMRLNDEFICSTIWDHDFSG